MITALLLLFQDVPATLPADPVVVDKTTTWIGLASVVATMIFSIVRQELAARRVTKETIETKQEVQEKVAAVTEKIEEQKQVASEHRDVIAHEVKTAIIDAAAIRSNQYHDAAAWRQYIDDRVDQMAARATEMANSFTAIETWMHSVDDKLDELKQQCVDLRRR